MAVNRTDYSELAILLQYDTTCVVDDDWKRHSFFVRKRLDIFGQMSVGVNAHHGETKIIEFLVRKLDCGEISLARPASDKPEIQ